MKKLKFVSAVCLSAFLSLSQITNVFADQVNVTIIEKSNVDILLTTGSFDCNLDNFEQDVKSRLERDGLDTSIARIQAIDTSVTSSESMDASAIFNDWGRIGMTGKWSLSTVANYNTNGSSQAIYNSENTAGLTGFYCKDDYTHKDMTIDFDVKTTDGDDDSIGVFLRFNLSGGTTESTANASKKATTYMYLEEIGPDTHVLPNGLYKINNQIMPKDSAYSSYVNNKTIVKLQAPMNTTNKLTKNSWRHYKFVMEKNNIKVYRGGTAENPGTLIIDYTDPAPIESGSFGFVNWSQPATFANFVAACKTERDYGEILTEPTWRSDAKHIIVNVDSEINESLLANPEVLTRTFADDIYFLQWGSDKNKASAEEFIEKNDGKGMFMYGTTNAQYEEAIEKTVKYIEDMLSFNNVNSQYVVIGRETDLNVAPERFKTGAVNVEHPDGRWIVHHDYTYFDNNLGQSMQTENYTPDLILNFDKPGAYNIYFDDTLVKTIYAHRLPVADFVMNLQSNKLTLTSNSYDEDSNIDKGYGPGIEKETWSYKEADASEWITGKLEDLESGKTYIIKLEVEDAQGATAYVTKYVGAGNPVSYFLTDKSQFSKFYKVNLTDASYDPEGYEITDYEWTLKSGKNTVATYTDKAPNIDFTTFGAGEYTLSLKVKNAQNTWSENYTRGLTVIEDTVPPSVTIDPTYCDWTSSQDIHIQIEDKESGLDKWRYCYTQSQSAPEESQWGGWLTSEDTTLTFDTDGEYYLHFEAYDIAGNKLERTVGSYKITHPYTNKVNHNFADANISKSEFYTYDWGKWYSPTDEFKFELNGFKFKDNFNANYPVAGTTYKTGDRIKQPSNTIEFDFYYEPEIYNITYDYAIDCDTVDNPTTYSVLDGFKLKKPSKLGYEFIGWRLNGKYVDNINYGTNDFATFESFETAMKHRVTGNITLEAVWHQIETDADVNVFATIADEYKVTIPKFIVLDGKTSSASYKVKAEGDIAGIETINVIPDESFYINSFNKDAVKMQVKQDKTSWACNELDTETNGNVSGTLSAGKWSGIFNFNISIDNDEENINSTESVEYQTIEMPIRRNMEN